MTSRFSSPFHGGESDDDALFGSSSSRAVAVPMPTPPSSLMTRYADADFAGSLPRSFHTGTFIAGHSVFARAASGRRTSFDYGLGPRGDSITGTSPQLLGAMPSSSPPPPPPPLRPISTDTPCVAPPSSQNVEDTPVAAVAVTSSSAAAAAAAAAATKATPGSGAGGVTNDALYGVINAVVALPTMISFAAIVYSHPTFKPLLGQLARLSFASAALHQLVFTLSSRLPFAVGQPQDVGLIFLSSMASGVADYGRDEGLAPEVVVGTALLLLTLATLIVGGLLLIVARFRLATLVQYVPLPVVGGYLGYVGYFCFAAGLGLGCNVTINTFSSWAHLASTDALIKLVPTVAAATALWVAMTRSRSPWALPLTLVAVPVAFHAYLLASGTPLARAQEAGWVLKPEGKATEQFWELYNLFNISDWQLTGISMTALLRQLPKVLGLFFVVVFGSCLDVLAIQADMPYPIDFDAELATVGVSNVVVGLSGFGYTGSYIFSQTIFSMRANVSTYVHGAVITAIEFVIFLLPFSVVQYLPNFFFGALLMVFGIEISGDWLVRSAAKVSRPEYALLLATFVCIMQLELEMGVAAGVLLCIVYFVWAYSKANMAAFTVLPSRSAAVRSYHESHVLEALAGRTATVALSGFLFFGSSTLLSAQVVKLADDMIAAAAQLGADKAAGPLQVPSASSDRPRGGKDHARAAIVPVGSSGGGSGAKELRLASLAALGSPQLPSPGSTEPASAPHHDAERLRILERQAPFFVILDFRRVLGLDATAAQTLGSLALVLRRKGVELVLTRVTNSGIRRLLRAHGVISAHDEHRMGTTDSMLPESRIPLLHSSEALIGSGDGDGAAEGCCRMFNTLNEGAKYTEDRLLSMAQASGLLREGLTGLTLRQFLAMHLAQCSAIPGADVDDITAELAARGTERRLPPGARVFSWGDQPDSFFLVLKGVVIIQVRSLAAPAAGPFLRPPPAQLDVLEVERAFASGQGAVVGITDYVLRRLRAFQADAGGEGVVLLEVPRTAFEGMAAEAPVSAAVLQSILLRDACLSEVYAYEVLERSSRA